MMKNTIVVLTGLAAALSLQPLEAQTASQPGASGGIGLSAKPSAGLAEAGAAKAPLLAALDLNHDGTIDADEISAAPKSLVALDKNKDGKLSADEYMPVRGAAMLLIALDANRDHNIDATELANAPGELRALDKNHDGKITPDELHLPNKGLSGGSLAPAAPGAPSQK